MTMLRLRDIMTKDVVTVDAGATVREAMELLAHHHVSGAPVVTGSSLVGVISATDLMAFAAALTGVPTERESRAWDEDDASPTADEMDDGNDAGGAFFSDLWEDAGADVSERLAQAASPEWNALEEHDVTEAMTRVPLITLSSNATAEMAAEVMRTNRIHRVLVTDEGTLVGIVSALDIVNAAADHRFTIRSFVFNRGR
jgi:CBS domain-containing protein